MAFGLQRVLSEGFERIDVALATMGGVVEQQLADSIHAFSRRDEDLAAAVIAQDRDTDRHERAVEQAVIDLLEAKRLAPENLRRAMTAVKIAAEMERTGDLAKNIAKRTRSVLAHDPYGRTRNAAAPVVRMAGVASAQLSGALDALFRSDPVAASAVREGDTQVDDLYNSVFEELLGVMAEDAAVVSAGTQIVFVAKNFERIGDHATNIAERVHYALTGEELAGDRPKTDVTDALGVAAG